jgi:hypothetical protein
MCGEMRNAHRILVTKPEGPIQLGRLGVVGRIILIKKIPNSVALAKLVPTFSADRGCRVVSATDSHGR